MMFYFRPWFDGHAHLRGPGLPYCKEAFKLIVGSVASQCSYSIVMPNSPVIKTVDEMNAYRELILSVTKEIAPKSRFSPIMTLYLTEKTPIEEIIRAVDTPWFKGFKLYPNGVTTGSEGGVTDFLKLEKVLKAIERLGSRLLIHGETMRPDVASIDAEEIFVKEDLPTIRSMFSGKICLEHCSTKAAIDAVLADDNMWGSITPHHLMFGSTDTTNPHYRCKPVLQIARQRQYVLENAIRLPSNKFFAGTDTAAHLESMKLSEKVPNGCFSSPNAILHYYSAFKTAFPIKLKSPEGIKAFIDRMNDFLYLNAANFYGIAMPTQNISTKLLDDTVIAVVDQPSYAPSADEFCFINEAGQADRIVPVGAELYSEFTALKFLSK